mmetsp:Transcript_104035/g.275051  ORF Transcript_104035/g.275051 Transcript_104035/m.275051 type:complete len:300 (-) Transcript_104035:3-902(-)
MEDLVSLQNHIAWVGLVPMRENPTLRDLADRDGLPVLRGIQLPAQNAAHCCRRRLVHGHNQANRELPAVRLLVEILALLGQMVLLLIELPGLVVNILDPPGPPQTERKGPVALCAVLVVVGEVRQELRGVAEPVPFVHVKDLVTLQYHVARVGTVPLREHASVRDLADRRWLPISREVQIPPQHPVYGCRRCLVFGHRQFDKELLGVQFVVEIRALEIEARRVNFARPRPLNLQDQHVFRAVLQLAARLELPHDALDEGLRVVVEEYVVDPHDPVVKVNGLVWVRLVPLLDEARLLERY